MSDDSEKFAALREKFGHLVDPKLAEKYGDPFDPDDIRNVEPTKRRAHQPGLSTKEEVDLLACDMELLQKMVSTLFIDWMGKRLDDNLMARIFDKPSESSGGTGQYL